jgi:hypothetical protein
MANTKLANRIEEVQKLIINAIGQTMGADYFPGTGENNNKLADLDTWKLADVGKDMEDAGKTDVFTKTLMVQIADWIMDNRTFSNSDLPNIYKTAMEYGGYILKVRLGLYEVEDDPKWMLQGGKSYSDDEHTPVLPVTYAKIFEELKAVRIKWTVYNDTLNESMTTWEMMASYIAAMEAQVENTLALYTRVLTKQLINAGIAISDKATKTARHVLTEAIAKGLIAEGATASDFYKSDECIDYVLNEIKLTKDYMREYTSAFNNKTAPTFTPDEDNNLVILSAFERIASKRTASLYHDNKMDLGDYYKMNWWQAVNDTDSVGDIATTSSIKISADNTNKMGIGDGAYSVSNVIAFAYDTLAIGIAERTANKVTSSYTASCDFWNMWNHIALNAWVDSSYNMIAFIVD